MTTQKKQTLPELRIRNQLIAVFASLFLKQEARIESNANKVGFVFSTELSFRQINSHYRNSDIHLALEKNIAYGKKRLRLLNNK
jgi:hypothetical protein